MKNTVGDPSDSKSEKYRLKTLPRRTCWPNDMDQIALSDLVNPAYGTLSSRVETIARGKWYQAYTEWISPSMRSSADYDYTMKLGGLGLRNDVNAASPWPTAGEPVWLLGPGYMVYDPDYILGTYWLDNPNGVSAPSSFCAAGKSTTVVLPWLNLIADMDGDGDTSDDINNTDEDAAPGLVLPVSPVRRKLVMQCKPAMLWDGSVELVASKTGTGHVKIYEGSGTTPIIDTDGGFSTPNFHIWSLSTSQRFSDISAIELWIEAVDISSAAGDIRLELSYGPPSGSAAMAVGDPDTGLPLCKPDTVLITVAKVDLLQAGFDAKVGTDEIDMKKTGTDWTQPVNLYASGGDTDIVDPVWRDADLDNAPEAPDPVCFRKCTVPKIAGEGKTKLKIMPNLGTATIAAKIKVEATAVCTHTKAGDFEPNTVWADNLVFGPADVVLTGDTIDVPGTIAEASKTVGAKVDNFIYKMKWKISLDGGTTYSDFQDMEQQVLVTSTSSKPDYCSDPSPAYPPFTWATLIATARRMVWACNAGRSGSDKSDLPDIVANYIHDNPKFSLDQGTQLWNPFEHLDENTKGDCIRLANLSSTALRLLGIDARPHRAWCVMVNTVDAGNKETWGWRRSQINTFNASWYLAFDDNCFEGFFYVAAIDDPYTAGVYPRDAWVVHPRKHASLPASKARYLPIKVIEELGTINSLPNLCWFDDTNPSCPDINWSPSGSISGVEPINPCTTWTPNHSDDAEYSIVYTKTAMAKTLKLGAGVSQPTAGDGLYTLPCGSPAGSISVMVTDSALPSADATARIQICPARHRATVP